MTTEPRILNVGIVGLGVAAGMVISAVRGMEAMRLVAGADVNPKSREIFHGRTGAKAYGSVDELCADPEIDVVWVATPTTLHCPHVVQVAESRKHVVVEKPMAVSLDEAQRMIDAAERNGVQLVCGGSRSAAPAVRKMREVVRSGELGRVRAMSTWASTDWMLRGRRPDEIDVSQGGGVAYRQAPHQVDTVRLIGGGLVRSVRATTAQWMPPRDTAPGYFSAHLEFQDGTPATLIYNGYGYFMASELFDPGMSGPDEPGTAGRVRARREIKTGTRDEAAVKEERGLSAQRGSGGDVEARLAARFLADLGLLVVCCELGDMRQAPEGVFVYSDEGTQMLTVADDRRSQSPELIELSNALSGKAPILHGGAWGLATLEVCLAMMQSANEHREIELRRQVAVPKGF